MKKVIFTIFTVVLSFAAFAQVAINNDSSLPDPSAMLDVKSDTAGILIPRMTAMQRDAINNPAQGLLVFVTDDNTFYYFDSNSWQSVGSGNTSYWNLNGSTVSVDSLYSVAIGKNNTSGTFEVSTQVAGNPTGDVCTGGTVTAQEYGSPYIPAHLFDDDLSSIWRNDNSLPVWIQYDFGASNKKSISKYRLYWAGSNYDMTPYSWEFLASDDGVTWTTLDSQTGQNNWVSGEWREYTFSNSQSYQIYRLNITDNNGVGNTGIYIQEMEMMEMNYSQYPALFIAADKVGIGTQVPSASLEVEGTFKLVDGNQADGKILSSDAGGNASWVTAETLGITDKDFYKAGTTEPPSSINDDIYTMGNVAIGKNTAAYPLELQSTTAPRGVSVVLNQNTSGTVTGAYHSLTNTGDADQFGIDNQISGSSSGEQYGVSNTIDNSGTGMHYGVMNSLSGANIGDHFGVYNNLTGTGTGKQYGVRNEIFNSNDNLQYGNFTAVYGNGDGDHFGNYTRLFGSGNGNQYGVYDSIYNSGSGNHYGAYHALTGSGMGEHVGTYNFLSSGIHLFGSKTLVNGSATYSLPVGQFIEVSGDGIAPHKGQEIKLTGAGLGQQFGSLITIDNSGDQDHYGNYTELTGTGAGNHTALYNTLSNSGDGDQIGVYTNIDNSGNGAQYGNFNLLTGVGTGNKYGTYNRISSTAGGTHYAVYGEAEKSGSYAGYFKGEVATTQDYNYVTPKTYKWHAMGVDFRKLKYLGSHTVDYDLNYAGSVKYTCNSSLGFIQFSAGINLPDGAVITKITAYAAGIDVDHNSFSVYLQRKNVSTGDVENVCGTGGDHVTDYSSFVSTSINLPVVDNTYPYYLKFRAEGNDDGDAIALHAVTIEYTLDKVSH